MPAGIKLFAKIFNRLINNILAQLIPTIFDWHYVLEIETFTLRTNYLYYEKQIYFICYAVHYAKMLNVAKLISPPDDWLGFGCYGV